MIHIYDAYAAQEKIPEPPKWQLGYDTKSKEFVIYLDGYKVARVNLKTTLELAARATGTETSLLGGTARDALKAHESIENWRESFCEEGCTLMGEHDKCEVLSAPVTSEQRP